MRILRQSSYAAVPWKNGGGITHEAIRVPEEGESFQWRVSIAQVDASGPFSDFSPYRRYMVLLKGAGVVLRFTGQDGSGTSRVRELARVGDMEEFDGGLATQCDLIAGPCVDLNLMVSKAMPGVEARVEPLHQPWSQTVPPSHAILAIPLDAAVELRCGETAATLEPWDLALISGQEDRSVIMSSQGDDARVPAQMFIATLPASFMARQQ